MSSPLCFPTPQRFLLGWLTLFACSSPGVVTAPRTDPEETASSRSLGGAPGTSRDSTNVADGTSERAGTTSAAVSPTVLPTPGSAGTTGQGGQSTTSPPEMPPLRVLAWNGESEARGAGWATPDTNPILVQTDEAHSPPHAVKWSVERGSWNEWGWNWTAWQPPGTVLGASKIFTFALKLAGRNRPDDVTVSIRSAFTSKYARQPPTDGGARGVNVHTYEPAFADGQWHVVNVPLDDLLATDNVSEFGEAFEVFFGAVTAEGGYQLYLDDVGFR